MSAAVHHGIAKSPKSEMSTTVAHRNTKSGLRSEKQRVRDDRARNCKEQRVGMLENLSSAGLGLHVLLEESKRPVDDEELKRRIDAIVERTKKKKEI